MTPIVMAFSRVFYLTRDTKKLVAITIDEGVVTFHFSDGSCYIVRDDSLRNIKSIVFSPDKARCDLKVFIKPIIDYIVCDDTDITIVLK